jgi:hypothetical protein
MCLGCIRPRPVVGVPGSIVDSKPGSGLAEPIDFGVAEL